VELKKERTKRGLLDDGIRVITTDSVNNSHLFCNLFKRDEAFGILEQLANQAMHRMLKHTNADEPGAALNASGSAKPNALLDAFPGPSKTARSGGKATVPSIKQNIDEQKRNERFQVMFHLPATERLLDECRAIFWMMDVPEFGKYYGRLYFGESFLCFETYSDDDCSLVLPYFAVRRLERVNTASQVHALSIATCHQLKYSFQLGTDLETIERVCGILMERLRANIPIAKASKPLMDTLATEALLDNRDVTYGGFGLRFGYVHVPWMIFTSLKQYF
jgi:hypothetical protein